MSNEHKVMFVSPGGARQAMPDGPGRTLTWLLTSEDLRGQLEAVGMDLVRVRGHLEISLESLQEALERLLARARNDDVTLDGGERIQELLWVTARARKEKGQTHLLLTTPGAERNLQLVIAPEPSENLAVLLMANDLPMDLSLLEEAVERWPLDGVDLKRLMERLLPLIGEDLRGPTCARLLGLIGDTSAIAPLDEGLLRAPNQTHRLAIIEALGYLGERDRGIRTLRSMLAHGAPESHDPTVTVVSALARAEHCDILFGMALLVQPPHRCVLASLMYRFGDLRGYAMMESATAELNDSFEQEQLIRALEALGQTHSTRFIPMADDLHQRLSNPWCKALALRVRGRLENGNREPSPETLLETAEITANDDNVADSLKQIEELLALRPQHQRALYIKAFLYKEMDRLDDALEVTQRALEIDPNNWQLQRLTGSLHWDIGAGHAALKAYDRAISQQPTDPYSWYYKGYVLYRMKRYKEALPCLERAQSLQPDSSFILNQKGFCLEHLGRIREAVAAYQLSARLQPQDLRTQEYLGQALQTLGDLDHALRVFDGILRVSPMRESALFQRADILCEKQRWTEAIAAYDAYLKLYADSFRAWFNCGLCHRHDDNPREAADCFRRALRLRPESRSARAELERCLRLMSP